MIFHEPAITPKWHLYHIKCSRQTASKRKDSVMKNLLLAAAAATMVIAVSPAFAASPADDAEWNISPYPSAGTCHFVREPVTMQNGHVVYRNVQVCN